MRLLDRLTSGAGSVAAVRHRVRKAVFPVAGLGTRFLPATKAVPKELLSLVDRPLIQYAVEEALAAGIEELILVTHRSKRAIEDYFDRMPELESELLARGRQHQLEELHSLVPAHVRVACVRQPVPLGLGNAIECARPLIGNEPFAVILPDDLIDGEPPLLKQMIERFERDGESLVAVAPVPQQETSKYGIVDVGGETGTVARLNGIVEKPVPERAPSRLAVVGRYVFSPGLLPCLDRLAPGSGNEIQLTDAIARLLQREPVHAFRFQGTRYDCGSKLGFLAATLSFASRHPELGVEFNRLLRSMAAELAPAERVAAEAGGTGRPGSAHLSLVA
jgi:UTP--glucose-1-phosphate uridylyltransferase